MFLNVCVIANEILIFLLYLGLGLLLCILLIWCVSVTIFLFRPFSVCVVLHSDLSCNLCTSVYGIHQAVHQKRHYLESMHNWFTTFSVHTFSLQSIQPLLLYCTVQKKVIEFFFFLLLLDLVSLTNWVTKEDRLMSFLHFVVTELLCSLWILMVSMRRCYKGQWYCSKLHYFPIGRIPTQTS